LDNSRRHAVYRKALQRLLDLGLDEALRSRLAELGWIPDQYRELPDRHHRARQIGPRIHLRVSRCLRWLELQCEIRPRVNARFIKQSLSDRNRRACAEGKIEGVTWSAVEFFDLTVTVGNQPR
jgi:hypothetical protein